MRGDRLKKGQLQKRPFRMGLVGAKLGTAHRKNQGGPHGRHWHKISTVNKIPVSSQYFLSTLSTLNYRNIIKIDFRFDKVGIIIFRFVKTIEMIPPTPWSIYLPSLPPVIPNVARYYTIHYITM